MADEIKDVFICHASEDKESVVRPLVEACTQASISCWLDEAEIGWGDSVTEKINHGLTISRYVIVVFSGAFLRKNWPQRELNAVLNQEASSGEVKVLPLIVGEEQERLEVVAKYPLLNDKKSLPWDGRLDSIISALLSRLGRHGSAGAVTTNTRSPDIRIPLPRIAKQFSQRDKDVFLRESFAYICNYFRTGLQEAERSYGEVQTDISEVHNFKFLATIYVRGEVRGKCKVWIGALTNHDGIAYQQGNVSIENDSTFHELLTVAEDGVSLGFVPMMNFHTGQSRTREHMSAEAAAQYLWVRFTNDLQQGGR